MALAMSEARGSGPHRDVAGTLRGLGLVPEEHGDLDAAAALLEKRAADEAYSSTAVLEQTSAGLISLIKYVVFKYNKSSRV